MTIIQPPNQMNVEPISKDIRAKRSQKTQRKNTKIYI